MLESPDAEKDTIEPRRLKGGYLRKIGVMIDPCDIPTPEEVAFAEAKPEEAPKLYVARRVIPEDAREGCESSEDAYHTLDIRVYQNVLVGIALSIGAPLDVIADMYNEVFWPMRIVAAVPTHLYTTEDGGREIVDTKNALVKAKLFVNIRDVNVDLVPSVACAAAAFREVYMGSDLATTLLVIDAGHTKIDVALVDVDRNNITVVRAEGDGSVGFAVHKQIVLGRCMQLIDALMSSSSSSSSSCHSNNVVPLIIGGYAARIGRGLADYLMTKIGRPAAQIAPGDAPLMVAKGAAVLCRDAHLVRMPGIVQWSSLKRACHAAFVQRRFNYSSPDCYIITDPVVIYSDIRNWLRSKTSRDALKRRRQESQESQDSQDSHFHQSSQPKPPKQPRQPRQPPKQQPPQDGLDTLSMVAGTVSAVDTGKRVIKRRSVMMFADQEMYDIEKRIRDLTASQHPSDDLENLKRAMEEYSEGSPTGITYELQNKPLGKLMKLFIKVDRNSQPWMSTSIYSMDP